jgi:hypothetical protein
MQYELRLHRLIATILAAVLIGFVALFVYLDHHAPDVWIEASAALVMEIAVATGLVYVGMAEGVLAFQFKVKHKREIVGYLILSALSIGCGLFLSLTKSSPLMAIALVVSPHVLLFGVAQLRLSQHITHHSAQRRALQMCGLCDLLMGVGLIWTSRVSDTAAAGFLAYVAAMTALQLVGLLTYKRGPREQSV